MPERGTPTTASALLAACVNAGPCHALLTTVRYHRVPPYNSTWNRYLLLLSLPIFRSMRDPIATCMFSRAGCQAVVTKHTNIANRSVYCCAGEMFRKCSPTTACNMLQGPRKAATPADGTASFVFKQFRGESTGGSQVPTQRKFTCPPPNTNT